jgi:hypothetical protein
MFIVQVFPKLACILNHTVRRSLWAALDVVQLVKVKKKKTLSTIIKISYRWSLQWR